MKQGAASGIYNIQTNAKPPQELSSQGREPGPVRTPVMACMVFCRLLAVLLGLIQGQGRVPSSSEMLFATSSLFGGTVHARTCGHLFCPVHGAHKGTVSFSFYTHFNRPFLSPLPSILTPSRFGPPVFSYPLPTPLSSESSMATPSHGHKCRCNYIPNIGGPKPAVDTRENHLASMVPSERTPLIGMFSSSSTPYSFLRYCISGSPELPSAGILEASQGCNRSFELLKRTLSSRDGRESLYVLPNEQAIEVIDILEQVSAQRLARATTS
jgi:hypothetical protein